MNWLKELSKDQTLQANLFFFWNRYGKLGLEQALQTYIDLQQAYICRTRTSISKVSIYDILYLEIRGHHITVHTQYDTYQKYGSLNTELKILAMRKIKTIQGNNILLFNGTKLYMSRIYAPRIITEFTRNSPSLNKK